METAHNDITLPPYDARIKIVEGRRMIFDTLRRKYVRLTPEEWVRQHFVHFLIIHKGFPSALIANEVKLKVGNKVLRADTVLYDTLFHPRMIIEYKSPDVAIGQAHIVAWSAEHLFGDEAALRDRRHYHAHCWRSM